jgi:hypothetical protein
MMLTKRNISNTKCYSILKMNLYFDARCINDCLILLATANEISRVGGGGGTGGDK